MFFSLCDGIFKLKPVVGMAVQVTELPNGGICPSAAVILFGFTFQFEEMGTQIVTVSQISHDVEKPITHPAWEIGHLVSSALLREIKCQFLTDFFVIGIKKKLTGTSRQVPKYSTWA
jgi:hypothetical protein